MNPEPVCCLRAPSEMETGLGLEEQPTRFCVEQLEPLSTLEQWWLFGRVVAVFRTINAGIHTRPLALPDVCSIRLQLCSTLLTSYLL